ncbi:MAG: ATP-binding cassette domain-containing protein [Rhizomicrobium sp.]
MARDRAALGRAVPGRRPVLLPDHRREHPGALARIHHHVAGADERDRLDEALHGRGLDETAAPKHPSELSGGMKKRAGLARALALDPDIVFLDEPTAGLDPISANMFDELVKDLQKSLNLTVFMVTHDLDTLRATTDRIAVLVDKKIVVGPIDELRKNPHPWIQEYFSGPRGRAAA